MGIAVFVAGVLLWGAAAGLLVPRAAYRLSVEAGAPWRSACPWGHALTGPARGWLGRPRCPGCAAAAFPAGREPDPGATFRPGRGPRTGRDGAFAAASRPVLATTLVCLALGAGVGARPELVAWLLLAPLTVLLCLVDRAVHRLPDVLTFPLAVLTAAALGVAALFPGAGGSWPRALLGGLVLGGCYFLLFLINPRGMGFGDVKLALAVGQILGWYGWPVLFAGTFAAFLAGAVHGLTLIALRRADRTSPIPFGPFMAGGALAGVMYAGLGLGAGLGL
ncbi:prepilin peptidase [Streptomyces sp. NBC_00503]|uniref:prepilin peptidase n=1 Tax=Streptomyces sp. NBC_00503 TaxID=2903659 RepID=UPI002E81AD6B|nr:A24 family peptidase [Streptomyces sp. NBC_00503]WUD82978.1 A24 family peptidase [Streptomyces sp. NBC_00503]